MINHECLNPDDVKPAEVQKCEYKEKETKGRLLISSFVPEPECVAPGDEIMLFVTVKNEGDKKLSDVKITASIPDLSLRAPSGPYSLKKNSPISKVLFLEIPYYAEPGIYYIRLTATSNSDSTAKHRIIEINDAC